MLENTNNDVFGIDNLFQLIWPRRKPVLLVTAFACVASAILSGPTFIKPKYQSTLILYPPSTNSIKSVIDKDQRFGNESDGDEYVQILQSGSVRDSIITRFNLIAHYEMDTSHEQYIDELALLYDKNIVFERTSYNSIRIRVRDEDPVKAAHIVNSLPAIADALRARVLYSNYNSAYQTARRLFEEKLKIVESLFDSLNHKRVGNYSADLENKKKRYLEKKNSVDALSEEISELRTKYGVFDLQEQTNELFTQLTKAQSQFLGDSGQVEIIKQTFSETDTIRRVALARLNGSRLTYNSLAKKFNALSQSNKRFVQLADRLTIEKNLLAEFEADYLRSLNAFEPNIPSLAYEDLRRRYDAEFTALSGLKTLSETAYNNMTQGIPQSFVISKGEVTHKKVFPIRWMIVLFSTAGAFLLTLAVFSVMDRLRHIKT